MFKRLLELLKPKKQQEAAIEGNTLLAVRALIGKKVNVDISWYSYGFCYPDENILIDVTDKEYVFKSDDIDSEDHLWRFPIKDNDCSCEVSLAWPLTVEAKSSCLKYCSKFALCLMAIAFSLC